MARQPLPHEADLFEEVYIDETNQNGPGRYLVIGGITIPRTLSQEFEAEIIKARWPRLAVQFDKDMKLSEIGWNDVCNGDFEKYTRVMDAYFSFGRRQRSTKTNFGFFCSVVDLNVRGRRYSGQDGQIGFNREIYFHCLTMARRHKQSLFHVYPDERTTSEDMTTMRDMLCNGLLKEPYHNNGRTRAFRRVQFQQSHNVQALQISDILIGAVQYRLNGYFDKPGGADKKRLSEYILRKGGYWAFTGRPEPVERAFTAFQVWVRKHVE